MFCMVMEAMVESYRLCNSTLVPAEESRRVYRQIIYI